ncbi:MAG: hypothetical protein AMJ65_04025 [Phycisphaerae bacterium SG8_4]|nr:MAG: hypothetical protein AMJ65_04025 [Phycisphaerae bacterium SG8_4]
MKSIDMKSLIIGLLLGLCAVFAAGAVSGGKNRVGRYRLFGTANGSSCMVLDSQTGQVWYRYNSTSGFDWGSPDEWKKK